MTIKSFALVSWSWTAVSVLGSKVFGQSLMESCERGDSDFLRFPMDPSGSQWTQIDSNGLQWISMDPNISMNPNGSQ